MSPNIQIGPLHGDDWGWVMAAMKSLPGGSRLSVDQCRHAIERSVCVAAYHGKMIVGVVRVVTDGATFSSLTDIYVSIHWRKTGIGAELVEAALGAVKGTVCVLQCEPEVRGFYSRLGFAECPGVMTRGPS